MREAGSLMDWLCNTERGAFSLRTTLSTMLGSVGKLKLLLISLDGKKATTVSGHCESFLFCLFICCTGVGKFDGFFSGDFLHTYLFPWAVPLLIAVHADVTKIRKSASLCESFCQSSIISLLQMRTIKLGKEATFLHNSTETVSIFDYAWLGFISRCNKQGGGPLVPLVIYSLLCSFRTDSPKVKKVVNCGLRLCHAW